MSSNLIFHIVSRRKFQKFNQGVFYKPHGEKYEEGIVCVKTDQLKQYINSNFQGRRQLLVLVIDKSRLINTLKDEKENKFLIVKDRIYMDAILDKILINPNEEGIFDIEVSED